MTNHGFMYEPGTRLGEFVLYFEEVPLFSKYHIRLVRKSKKSKKGKK